MGTEFNPRDLSHIFKNVYHKPCSVPGFTYAYDIKNEHSYIAELFYSEPMKEWAIIVDNFPMQRQSFRCDFPIGDLETLTMLLDGIKIELVKS